jgi:hypothetical protein
LTIEGRIVAVFGKTTSSVSRALPAIRLIQLERSAPVLHMPSPRAAIRHALPVVFEAVIAPVVTFYVAFVIAGFRGALVAALVFSTLALARRMMRGDRISTLLLLDVALLTVRTVIAFITRSPLLYFIQPLAWGVLVALALLVSAIIRRPFTQRFVHDFCPLDPEFLARPRVQQFFVRVSVLWAAVLLANASLVLWVLLTSSLRTFVLERTGIAWTLTAGAIVCSILGFTFTMRRDGIRIQWGK